MKICLDNYLYINLLSIETIEKVFIKYGGLDKHWDTFSISREMFSDGTYLTHFDSPKGMRSAKAHSVVDKVAKNIMNVKICDLLK